MAYSNATTRTRSASSPDATWINRIVYESAAGTVAISTTPASQVPFGIVRAVDTDRSKVDVVVHGEADLIAGTGGLTPATDSFVAAENNDSAALDGRGIPATAGDYYVGRLVDLNAESAAGSIVRVFVNPGQLSVAAS